MLDNDRQATQARSEYFQKATSADLRPSPGPSEKRERSGFDPGLEGRQNEAHGHDDDLLPHLGSRGGFSSFEGHQ